jgi:dnd system-associated protein 4
MAEESATKKDRILIDESVIDVYKELKADSKTQPEQTPFNTFKDIFILASCLGFLSGSRETLPTGSKKHDFRISVFSKNELSLLRGIAIADRNDLNVLNDENTVFKIVEEYANAGIHDIKAYLIDESGMPLWNLISLIFDTHKANRERIENKT